MSEIEGSHHWCEEEMGRMDRGKGMKKRGGKIEMGDDNSRRSRERQRAREEKREEFRCLHCRELVSAKGEIGTEHRNHCPLCLWSQHVDLEKSGDRKSDCKASMVPIGLTFKHEGFDKWGKPRQGELMLIHRCTRGDKISINRIAGDDDAHVILRVFEESKALSPEEREALEEQKIRLLDESDKDQILTQLFGRDDQDRQAH